MIAMVKELKCSKEQEVNVPIPFKCVARLRHSHAHRSGNYKEWWVVHPKKYKYVPQQKKAQRTMQARARARQRKDITLSTYATPAFFVMTSSRQSNASHSSVCLECWLGHCTNGFHWVVVPSKITSNDHLVHASRNALNKLLFGSQYKQCRHDLKTYPPQGITDPLNHWLGCSYCSIEYLSSNQPNNPPPS